MTDETQPTKDPGTLTVEVKQGGNPGATATATVPAPQAPGLIGQIVLKFIDPSSLASLASTAVGLWMLVKQPDREVTAWALIAAGGLLVPAIGIAKKWAGANVSGAEPK